MELRHNTRKSLCWLVRLTENQDTLLIHVIQHESTYGFGVVDSLYKERRLGSACTAAQNDSSFRYP